MIIYETISKEVVKGKVLKCSLKVFKNGEMLRNVSLEYGKAYRVIPDNPRKMKHRDKVGVLVGFRNNEHGDVYQARIKFDETGKIGFVDIGDLHHFRTE
ncbi:hypothetical protein [Paenibacillus lactis]|uniref:hypothetical protein n=1 Tax=Paenibacillus lactis TaxID=228574 RepID=UPI003D71C26A